MDKEEHYKNNPNDIEPSIREKAISSKLNKLKYRYKVNDINKRVSIMLLRYQIHRDSIIKDMFIEMYPNEYRAALKKTFELNGFAEKRKVKKQQIIEEMKLKNTKLSKT